MRNRAKCRLCGDIIESFYRADFVSCKCDEISVVGGLEVLECGAKNWENFIRIDDEGNEIVVKVQDDKLLKEWAKSVNEWAEKNISEPTNIDRRRSELINMLDEMAQKIEDLPLDAALSPVSHTDLVSLILIISAIFRAS
jgi:hypothetical protein